MAGFAKGHEVGLGVGAALIDGADVVNFVSGDVTLSLKTLLAERVLGDIQVADDVPAVAVNLVAIRTAVELVVITVHLRTVNVAVTTVSRGVWTIGERAAAGG